MPLLWSFSHAQRIANQKLSKKRDDEVPGSNSHIANYSLWNLTIDLYQKFVQKRKFSTTSFQKFNCRNAFCIFCAHKIYRFWKKAHIYLTLGHLILPTDALSQESTFLLIFTCSKLQSFMSRKAAAVLQVIWQRTDKKRSNTSQLI